MVSLGVFLRGGMGRPNPTDAPLRIALARRLVETQGAPFVPTGEVFTDVASARDELGLLPAAQGPTVVRVQVEGSTASERKALAGDWLVDPDGGDRVLRLPAPQWNYDPDAEDWADGRAWLEAWETCPNAAWMLHAGGKAGIDRRFLILAACACVRTVLPFVRAGEARPLRAIEAAERWVRSEASLEDVRNAAFAASEAQVVYDAVSYAPRYAAEAASDAARIVTAVDHSAAAQSAAFAVSDAAKSLSIAANYGGSLRALAYYADLVRGVIPTLTVLRAVVARV